MLRAPISWTPSAAGRPHRAPLGRSRVLSERSSLLVAIASCRIQANTTAAERAQVARLPVQGLEHTELIAVGVSENNPRHTRSLADRHILSAQADQPLDCSLLIVRSQIEVETVLDGFVLRHPEKQEIRYDPVLRASRWRLKRDLITIRVRPPPTECGFPEGRALRWIVTVNADALNANAHGITLYTPHPAQYLAAERRAIYQLPRRC